MTSQQTLRRIIDRAVHSLYNASVIDNRLLVSWEKEDVRATSLALLTLDDLGEPPDSLLVKGALEWLRNQLGKEKYGNKTVGEAWEAQVWDTSLGLTVFKRLTHRGLRDVENWLHHVRSLNRRPTWHDEPWDTCFAAMALLEPPTSDCSWLPGTFVWLDNQMVQRAGDCSLQDNYHFTAFYLRLVALVKKLIARSNRQVSRLASQLDFSCEEGCTRYLIRGLEPEGRLWSGEIWLNAYCLLALLEASALPVEHEQKCITWFQQHFHRGAFGSVEDNSLAIQALYALYLHREHRRLMDELNKGDKEEIVRLAAASGRPDHAAIQRLRKDMVVTPPKLWTPRPDGSFVLYVSKWHIRWAARLAGIAAGLAAFLAAILDITDLWPF